MSIGTSTVVIHIKSLAEKTFEARQMFGKFPTNRELCLAAECDRKDVEIASLLLQLKVYQHAHVDVDRHLYQHLKYTTRI
jgi:hypothetical protein